mgnify:CR=1 FL=1
MKRRPVRVGITHQGTILLGGYTVCDGFEFGVGGEVAVYTHAHQDHLKGFESSILGCSWILLTEATRDLLIAMKGDYLKLRKHIVSLDYGEEFTYKNETIILYPAGHMIGSAQVLVEKDGFNLFYTSDFILERTENVHADVVVIDATYGKPELVRNYTRNEAIRALINVVEEGLSKGPVWIASYLSKRYEVMRILIEHGIEVPFYITYRDFKMAPIYEKYLGYIGELRPVNNLSECLRLTNPCIIFCAARDLPMRNDTFKIRLTGWGTFNNPVRKLDEEYYVIGLSNHADFKDLLRFIAKCKPKLVIPDDHRSPGHGLSLAKAVVNRLNIPAIPMPLKEIPLSVIELY